MKTLLLSSSIIFVASHTATGVKMAVDKIRILTCDGIDLATMMG